MRHSKSVRLGMQVAFGRVRRKTAPTGAKVRLGMQVAFGRVRRKTAPTGAESVSLFLGFTIKCKRSMEVATNFFDMQQLLGSIF